MFSLLGDVSFESVGGPRTPCVRFARVWRYRGVGTSNAGRRPRSEDSFRNPDEPFYWLAARLWLTIALDRVATEAPVTASALASSLLTIATSDDFPHVLVREFAQVSSQQALLTPGITPLESDREALSHSNTSSLPRRPARRQFGDRFSRSMSGEDERRFTLILSIRCPIGIVARSRSLRRLRGEDSGLRRALDRRPLGCD